MKTLIVIPFHNFQDMEYLIPKEILEEAGIKTETVSNKKGLAIGVFGKTVEINKTISEVNINDYDALIFVGGGGCLSNLDNEDSYKLIKETVSKNIILGSICISPVILAKAGVLKGRKATVWKSSMNKISVNIFQENNVIYKNEPVVVDKNIITAFGPKVADLFGKTIVNLLTKK